jgi:hypothetical protein
MTTGETQPVQQYLEYGMPLLYIKRCTFCVYLLAFSLV